MGDCFLEQGIIPSMTNSNPTSVPLPPARRGAASPRRRHHEPAPHVRRRHPSYRAPNVDFLTPRFFMLQIVQNATPVEIKFPGVYV